MKQFNRLVWETKYTVHVEELDTQHQKLFDITNNILDLFEKGSIELYSSLQALVQYSSTHFRSENAVMIEFNYPDYREQNSQHSVFIDKMLNFLKSFKESDKELTVKILSYLHEWIYLHTTTLDLKYGQHIMRIKGDNKK
jgi:hemerythrin